MYLKNGLDRLPKRGRPTLFGGDDFGLEGVVNQDLWEALADPSQAEVPVITIAMDAGFQSLGPFNRAFKATTGVTPTEYRRLKASAV